MKLSLRTLAAASVFGIAALTSQAALSTSAPGGATVIDFSQFASSWYTTIGPVQVGGLVGDDVTWSSTASSSGIGSVTYGVGGNGIWDGGRNGFVGLNTSGGGGAMSFTFANPVKSVGGFMNYVPKDWGDAFISVYGAGNTLLESYNVSASAPISTPAGLNDGAFRGVNYGSNAIVRLEISGAYSVLDDLSYTRDGGGSSVPDAGNTLGLLVLAVAGLITFRRKAHR